MYVCVCVCVCVCVSCSVMSNSLRYHRLQPTRLLCPWNSPGKNMGVGSHFLLQGIFLTQGSNPSLLHCRWILHCLCHQESPDIKPHNQQYQSRNLSVVLIFSKHQLLVSLNFFLFFLEGVCYFIDFCTFYYFLPSTYFGLNFLFFFLAS